MSLRSQMAYRRSLALEMVGFVLSTATELATVFILFEHFPLIAGWTLWEVIYVYGLTVTAFGIAEVLSSGLDRMEVCVREGTVDRMLVRPVGVFVQVLAYEIALFRLARLLPGFVVLCMALQRLPIDFSALTITMMLISIAGASLVFLAIFLASAAMCFWTVQGLEVFNAFTFGGREMGKFPMSVYPRWLRLLFFYGIPLGLALYFPNLVVLDKPDVLGMPEWMPWLTVPVSLAFLGLAVKFWCVGVNKYQSTGS